MTQRDPLIGAHFSLDVDGVVSASFKEASGFNNSTTVITHQAVDDQGKSVIQKIPGDLEWEDITLVNVIVTGRSTKCFDLERLSLVLLNTEYNSQKFAALKMLRQHPFCKALVFRSGRIVVVGSSTIEEAYCNLKWFEDRIKSVIGNVFQVKKELQNQ